MEYKNKYIKYKNQYIKSIYKINFIYNHINNLFLHTIKKLCFLYLQRIDHISESEKATIIRLIDFIKLHKIII
jgi:hypothetical protein